MASNGRRAPVDCGSCATLPCLRLPEQACPPALRRRRSCHPAVDSWRWLGGGEPAVFASVWACMVWSGACVVWCHLEGMWRVCGWRACPFTPVKLDHGASQEKTSDGVRSLSCCRLLPGLVQGLVVTSARPLGAYGCASHVVNFHLDTWTWQPQPQPPEPEPFLSSAIRPNRVLPIYACGMCLHAKVHPLLGRIKSISTKSKL